MSNLSDLLPAGAGGKNVSFTASGSITQGGAVGLNSDGTVSAIAQATEAVSSIQNIISTNVYYATDSLEVLYVPDGGYTVFFYTDSNGTNSYATVATNSGTTYTVGATTTMSEITFSPAAVYDTSTQRVILAYEERSSGNQYGHAIVGQITTPGGTPTITFGTASAFSSTNTNEVDITLDTSQNKPIIVWRNQGNGRFDSIVGNVVGGSTNSISFPSSYAAIVSAYPINPKVVYNTQENKLASFRVDASSPYPAYSAIGTITGNTISWSSEAQVGTGFSTENNGADWIYVPEQNVFFAPYSRSLSSSQFWYAMGNITNGMYYGLIATNFTPIRTIHNAISGVYDPDTKSITVTGHNSSSWNISYNNTTTIDNSTGAVTLNSSWITESSSGIRKYNGTATLVANVGKVVSFFADYTPPNWTGYGTTEFYTPSGTNVSKVTVIADATVTNGNTGNVTLKGGIATTQLASAVFAYNNQNFSVASQSSFPEEVRFKPDGTKFYILGGTNDAVYQYALSTAWDVSTASYENKSFSVQTQEANPQGLAINADGTSFYVCGQSKQIYQYDLTSAYDLSTASYANKSFNLIGQFPSSSPWGLHFDSTGTKLYVISSAASGPIFQYTLSSAFDISTASYANKTVNAGLNNTVSLTMTPDGVTLYVLDYGTGIYKYTLSVADDISTATYDNVVYNVTAQDTQPYGVAVKTDNTQLYITGVQNDSVYQYSLSTALTPNSVYYVADDGTISTTSTGLRIGKALSTSSINLEFET